MLAGLRVFVYSRRKEELLGGDGMDAFADVFGRDTRLTVILHREGWGKTPWTAVEENHIKSRALKTRFKSFMVIRLDDSEVPPWVPERHLYSSASSDSPTEMVAIVRARAREEGAVVRKLSAAEASIERARAARAE